MKKSFILLIALVLIIFASLGTVSADDMQLTDSGQVSGDVDVVTTNPWTTSGELTYAIPSDAKDIKSADVYINVYSGSAQNTYGLNANVSLSTKNGVSQIATEELWVEGGSTDGTIYPVNNHTYKCYSDYQMHYDITDSLKGLNGSSITIKFDSLKMAGKQFDGRIKLIALILAYDDGDDDKIYYWYDSTQKWTTSSVVTSFNTDKVTDIVNAELTNVLLSSGEGVYKLNGEFLGDSDKHVSGNYYQYYYWNILDRLDEGDNVEITAMSTGTGYGSIKSVLSFLKLESKKLRADVSFDSEYASVSTCYAGTNNTLTINAKANFAGKYLVELLADGVLVNSTEVNLDGKNQISLLLTDSTVRPADETTVNGGDNSKVTYSVNVKRGDVVVGSANKTVPVLYNGYLGKDLAYNATYIEDTQVFTVTGGVMADTKNDSTYMAGSALNRVDVFSIDLDNSSSLEKVFVYLAYNWDKSGVNGPVFNVTFNNHVVAPKSRYRDQGNLGDYGKYGYGLFIYDVTEFAQAGSNTLVINKEKGLTAVYPSTLIYLYNNTESDYLYNVYMFDGVDLLSNDYNNAGRIVKTENAFDVNTNDVCDVAFYVFAAGAQAGEGNVIFNGDEYADVWNGSSNSVGLYSMNISSSLADSNDFAFVATGSTFLALNQIVVATQKVPLKVTLNAKTLSTTYDSNKAFTVTAFDSKNNPISGLELTLKIFTGSSYVTKTIKTNSNGVASFKDASKLAIGTHKVEITSSNKNYDVKKLTLSIKVSKAKTTVKAPKVTNKYKKSQYFKVTVKNQATKNVVKNIKIKLKVYTGKKYTTVTVKTNSKGIAQYNTKSLKVGTHKVVVSSGDSKYTVSATSSIVIKK